MNADVDVFGLELKSHEKLILIFMLGNVKMAEEGAKVFDSGMKEISKRTGCALATVSKTIRKFRELNILERISPKASRHGKSEIYGINV